MAFLCQTCRFWDPLASGPLLEATLMLDRLAPKMASLLILYLVLTRNFNTHRGMAQYWEEFSRFGGIHITSPQNQDLSYLLLCPLWADPHLSPLTWDVLSGWPLLIMSCEKWNKMQNLNSLNCYICSLALEVDKVLFRSTPLYLIVHLIL